MWARMPITQKNKEVCMNELFSQGGKGSTGILTNKQAVARHFGVKQSEVVYFSVGALLTGYKVIYDKVSQRAYSLPADIGSGVTAVSLNSAGVLVHSAGSVDLGALAVTREEYVTLPGSFDTGVIVNTKNELVVFTDGKYRWDGALPKAVPADSTPTSTGGVGASAWVSVGDASLRAALAGQNGVDLVNGAAKQNDVDTLNKRTDVYAYIEDYANLVVGDDWSDAIQAAFDTGKPVIGLKGKTYKTTAIINSMGQPFIGSLKLQLARTTIPAATFEVDYSRPSNDKFIGVYVGTAYDLCEMLRIKSLGFNTVIHYLQFNNNSADSAGDAVKLANNCRTAGLNLVVSTRADSPLPDGTPAQIVAKVDSFDNVIGYNTIDEPATRGFTVEQQDTVVSEMRALTDKKLFCVDYIWTLSIWANQFFSQNYDVFLVNSYSMYYATGTLQQRVDKDLGKMRTDFGACMKMVGKARVIPAVQMYTEFTSEPVESPTGTCCFDVDQVVAASKVFAKAGNGDFAAFCWDSGFTTTIAKEPKYQDLIKHLVNHAGKGEVYRTEPIMFGGVGSAHQRSLHDLNDIVRAKDPDNTVDSWLGGNGYPVRLITGESETPTRTTDANVDISGIGFKSTFSRMVTRKSLLKYFTGYAVYENYGPATTGAVSFNVYSTPDAGYTETLRYSTGVSAGTPFRFSVLTTNNFDGIGEDAVFDLAVTEPDAQENYRKFIYGLFVSTNW